ncbi:hypothetical protein MC885_019006 [Smutsia gigantea]|nr:hypothetical protein MC885_019006 [Smutsia gigantea]
MVQRPAPRPAPIAARSRPTGRCPAPQALSGSSARPTSLGPPLLATAAAAAEQVSWGRGARGQHDQDRPDRVVDTWDRRDPGRGAGCLDCRRRIPRQSGAPLPGLPLSLSLPPRLLGSSSRLTGRSGEEGVGRNLGRRGRSQPGESPGDVTRLLLGTPKHKEGSGGAGGDRPGLSCSRAPILSQGTTRR